MKHKVACGSCGGTGFKREKKYPFNAKISNSKLATNGENLVVEKCSRCIDGWILPK